MSSDVNEKKPEIPTKSSMEILSELFSTFHAEPPLIIKKEKSESTNKKHKKKKKHKHKDRKHKKKDKKRKKSSSSSTDHESQLDLANILIKQEKDAAEKKIKIEGTNLSVDVKLEKVKEEGKKLSKKTSTKDSKSIVDSIEDTDGEITDSDSSKESKHKKKRNHKKRSRSRSRSSNRDRDKKKSKIDDLRNKLNKIEKKSKHSRNRSSDRRRSLEREQNEESDRYKVSKDDFYKGYRDRSRSRERDRYGERQRDSDDYSRSRMRDKDDGFYKSRDREEREDKWYSRDRYRGYGDREYRRRSDSRHRDGSDKIDKKKLLEIARKNAITMMKSGSLPGALTLGPQAQEKVIAAIKSGGKTIEELTDFCKTLSKKEELGELSSLSEKDDSDSDNDKPFHHPFQIKDRPTSITMNIKNSVPLPLKSIVERTSELRMQFPVSSGQQHRKGEKWMPVSPPPTKKIEEKAVSVPVVSNIPLPTAPLPIEMVPLATPSIPLPQVTHLGENQATIPAPSNVLPGPQMIPTPSVESVDISSIVSQRLTAMRKLQENPNDVQALTQMYKTNKEMQTWATSKQQLGQFTGSTGAQILSQAELSSGYQAWAKKANLSHQGTPSGFEASIFVNLWINCNVLRLSLAAWACISFRRWVGNQVKV